MSLPAERRFAHLVCRVLLACLLGMPAWAMQNQLVDHASPYLAMHGDDPVAWQDWGEEALQLARSQDKLIFVSSGYFSCHWCHVMQRESYRDPQIAALLNAHFIPVKIDRELHPALDAYLIDFVERTQGTAGWPLNVFLTPEGYPLVGMIYLPPERFSVVLERLDATWQTKRGKTRNLARRALLQLSALPATQEVEALPAQTLRESFLRQALAYGDPLEGGFGEQNKFPMSPQLLAMLELRGEDTPRSIDTLLTTTLDQMARRGLRDHLGGGFFRYTVDPSWLVPHFEKMLYTQAQLARVYLLAGRLYARDDYLQVARDTLDFALREMRGPQRGLIASFSAVDAAGEEGGPYLWHADELQQLLGEENAQLAIRHWDMQGPPPLDGGHLPLQGEGAAEIAAASDREPAQLAQQFEALRRQLLAARAERGLPADTKELAAWNGLMIGALAQAAVELREDRYGEAALQLAQVIRERLWQDGRLWRARAGDAPVGIASLADYAFLAEGIDLLLQWRNVGDLAAWRDQLLRAGWDLFHTELGWKASEQRLLPGMGQEAAAKDGALRAPGAVLMRLSLTTTDPEIQTRLRQALHHSRLPVQQEPFWYASHLLVLHAAATR